MTEVQNSKLSEVRWHCRRGMLELDILLDAFINKEYATLNTQQIKLFEMLLEYPDQVLFDLLMGKMQASNEGIANIVEKIRKVACC